MKLEDTYNIHKKINCILPFFKSKKLCKKGIHNYIISPLYYEYKEPTKITFRNGTIYMKNNDRTIYGLKCRCCGKETKLD